MTTLHAHRPATPLSTDDATRIDDVRIKSVRPLITPAILEEWLPAPEAAAFPPDLNLSPEAFLEGLTGHYLYAVLNDILYSSLMAENQRRYAQMESALSKLDEDRNQLRLAYNARRQEDITEEIEILLLAADLFRA